MNVRSRFQQSMFSVRLCVDSADWQYIDFEQAAELIAL